MCRGFVVFFAVLVVAAIRKDALHTQGHPPKEDLALDNGVLLLQMEGNYVQGQEPRNESVPVDEKDVATAGVVLVQMSRSRAHGKATGVADNGTIKLANDGSQGTVGNNDKSDSKLIVAICSLALVLLFSFVFVDAMFSSFDGEDKPEQRSCWRRAGSAKASARSAGEHARPLRGGPPRQFAPPGPRVSNPMLNSLQFFSRSRPHSVATSIPVSEPRLNDVSRPDSAVLSFSDPHDQIARG